MLSWFRKDHNAAAELYIDLGTANTIIAARGQGVLLNEPSLVAYTEASHNKKKILGVGRDAIDILAKTPGNILSQKPVRDGVIADFDLTQEMLRIFLTRPQIRKAHSRPRVVVSLPYGVTDVEKKAVVEACREAGARQVFLIDEPMAAAIGAGLPIRAATGNMIIDIGGGTTEIAVIALADIVYCEAVRVGGHRLDEAVMDYFKKNKGVIITDTLAEELKISIGTAVPKKDIRTAKISGRDVETGLMKNLEVSSEDVGQAMSGCLSEIVNAVHRALEKTPPELVSDIIENGVTLAGGGALIRDFDLRLRNEVRLPVRVAENPLIAIAKGGEKVLQDPELLDKIQLEI